MVTVASYVYFTPTPTSGAAPLSVAFVGVEYAGAGDTFVAGSWAYAFGDGQSSVGVQNPGHVYSAAGTYLVTMTGTFTTPSGSTKVLTDGPQTITVTAPAPAPAPAPAINYPWEPPPSFSFGYAGDADVSIGVTPTRPGLWWFHSMGEEIRNVIAAAGLTQDLTDPTQLTAAIRLLLGVAAPAPTLLGSAAGSSGAVGTGALSILLALIAAGRATAQGFGSISLAQALSGAGADSARGAATFYLPHALSGSGSASAQGGGGFYALSGAGSASARGSAIFFFSQALFGSGRATASGTAVLIP